MIMTELLSTKTETDITISKTEYKNLIACETLLDMILNSVKDGNSFPDSSVVKAAIDLRKIWVTTAFHMPYYAKAGDENAK